MSRCSIVFVIVCRTGETTHAEEAGEVGTTNIKQSLMYNYYGNEVRYAYPHTQVSTPIAMIYCLFLILIIILVHKKKSDKPE